MTNSYDRVGGLSRMKYIAAAQQLLQPALQQSQLLPEEASASASRKCLSSGKPAQQLHRLRLHWYHTDWAKPAGMLAALPAYSLTALELDWEYQDIIGVDGSTLSALLARLSSLQQLRLAAQCSRAGIPGECLAGIASLGQLTELVLQGQWRQLPQRAKQPVQQP